MNVESYDPVELATIAQRVLAQPGNALALVSLVAKTGSSYRQPGARMLVLRDGSTVGTISGGCLERELAALALQMQQEGRWFREHTIDTRPIFGCQGTITLWIECVEPGNSELVNCMRALHAAVEERRPVTLHTTGPQPQPAYTRIVNPNDMDERTSQSAFVQSLALRKRLVLIGAHGDVEAVVRLARMLDWECIQVVPGAQRSAWIAPETRGVRVLRLDPEEVIRQLQPDAATGVVIMTHHLGRDLSYARAVLGGGYAYVGMLGSARRRHELMNHLMDLGDASLILAAEQLHCPIGLDIGSETQEQIAMSVLAEVQAVFAGRCGGKLKDASLPIHP